LYAAIADERVSVAVALFSGVAGCSVAPSADGAAALVAPPALAGFGAAPALPASGFEPVAPALVAAAGTGFADDAPLCASAPREIATVLAAIESANTTLVARSLLRVPR
jgi:hypothetical protein